MVTFSLLFAAQILAFVDGLVHNRLWMLGVSMGFGVLALYELALLLL